MNTPSMQPSPGECQVAYVGDWLRFEISPGELNQNQTTHQAFLRTNLGRAEVLRKEIMQRTSGENALALFSWQDIPMKWETDRWTVELPLSQVGFFQAKPYLVDKGHRQTWPEGPNTGISVHPDFTRSANTIYCAWIRLFGESKHKSNTEAERTNEHLQPLDSKGYSVIPPSGKIRDLIEELPHIVDTLGCRIIHLLPINPTPTTFARFGRFGSPYAAQNLMAIDPALVEFDHHSTGLDQFRELADAVHAKGARLFIDLVANHTGWGADIFENHPEWYEREPSGKFISPGAWGNTWGDLVELRHKNPDIWKYLADVFLTWCQRGVDGFRCDAGYMVPVEAWQYITARVREEYPDTIFLLEGLGGAWEATESLLKEGGMQWAYSELFQEYPGPSVNRYMNHCIHQSPRVGTLVHYSETHDNSRLAAKSRVWSLLRNRLCGLTSFNGGFGFTCGVEWLAPEKIIVHECTGMNWGAEENIVEELSKLNRLISSHPCFFDGSHLTAHSSDNQAVYVLERLSREKQDQVWIIANTDDTQSQTATFEASFFGRKTNTPPNHELLGQEEDLEWVIEKENWKLILPPGAVFCLSHNPSPAIDTGKQYRAKRAQAALALRCLSQIHPIESTPLLDWEEAAENIHQSLETWLTEITRSKFQPESIEKTNGALYQNVVTWNSQDRPRVTPVPVRHWIVVREKHPFRLRWRPGHAACPIHMESVPVQDGHVAAYWTDMQGALDLELQIYSSPQQTIQARFYVYDADQIRALSSGNDHRTLLTNGRGAMARMHAGLEVIESKYDCLLGANLHGSLPVDRHVFIKRVRMWVNADGFITPLNRQALLRFEAGPPAKWRFFAPAGNGRSVELELVVDMIQHANTVTLRISRPSDRVSTGAELPEECKVSLTVRFDLEDRNFHSETQRNDGADHHFNQHCKPNSDRNGFHFTPADDRHLSVWCDSGSYHSGPEWAHGIPHPIEQTRGQTGHGDAFSPGWFELPLTPDQPAHFVASAEKERPNKEAIESFAQSRINHHENLLAQSNLDERDTWGRDLVKALETFVVKRDDGRTVIAGYPWFLDWGRDSLIAARGMLSAGMVEDVVKLLKVFGRFESHGTLPNTIHGENASNRDTSDAPLWYGVLCEETAALKGTDFYQTQVDSSGRTIREVLFRIAGGIMKGAPNGIRMDAHSGLVWSPSHFTWMDTNYPAGTPREGYPVEIQALWIRLLNHLTRLAEQDETTSPPHPYMQPPTQTWSHWLELAKSSFNRLFWLKEKGWPADVLIASKGTSAKDALRDQALRSNCLWTVSLGCLDQDKARSTVEAARKHLIIPGALRSLAPLPVVPHLPIYGKHGDLLNNPAFPYWGRYEGDEDTRRKPAYHNGTAWLWTFPTFCEALSEAWPDDPSAQKAAKDYLASMTYFWKEGCSGQLPEIADGDAPHTQRGCDAQAWSVSEALRVWRKLNHPGKPGSPSKSITGTSDSSLFLG
jgi:predicted glycogen debranching enzyme